MEDFAPSTSATGAIWSDQFSSFRSTNSNIGLDIILKKADSKGGMLDSLMSTRRAVPALLPDVAIVNGSDAWVLSDAKILQPLNGLVPSDLGNGLYPFANQYSGPSQWVAIPFAADVQHLVYNPSAVSTAPRTWDDLARQKAAMLVPLGGDDGFLLQYLAFGASLDNFDTIAATQIFGFIKRGRETGFLSDSALTTSGVDDAWSAFVSNQVVMAQVSASRYWSERDHLPTGLNTAFAPVPTRDGRIATPARSWAFVILADDPGKKGAAAALIRWLLRTDRLKAFLQAGRLLPTYRGMIGSMIESKEYATFLNDLMEHAIPLPSSAQYAKKAEAWRAGVSGVWRGQTTPEEAARSIATAK
jgi:ABC-type glycerol-3-phosphate transport system substrate-binding protein